MSETRACLITCPHKASSKAIWERHRGRAEMGLLATVSSCPGGGWPGFHLHENAGKYVFCKLLLREGTKEDKQAQATQVGDQTPDANDALFP